MGAQVICPTNFDHISRNSMLVRESVKGVNAEAAKTGFSLRVMRV
jgi:hypothetical protein